MALRLVVFKLGECVYSRSLGSHVADVLQGKVSPDAR
jgi:hypothetical protein